MVISPLEHFSSFGFKEVISDEKSMQGEANLMVFTSGKIYYELYERCQKLGRKEISIIRIEQLYPFPVEEIRKIILKNPKAKRLLWVQDEPENMGVWPYIARKYPDLNFELISRRESASPAAGLPDKHKRSLEQIMDTIFS